MPDKKQNIRIALAQTNPTVGDLRGNSGKIMAFVERAVSLGADIIAFPELAVTGYPPEDLLFKPQFIKENIEEIKRIAEKAGNIAVVVGFVDMSGGNLYTQ